MKGKKGKPPEEPLKRRKKAPAAPTECVHGADLNAECNECRLSAHELGFATDARIVACTNADHTAAPISRELRGAKVCSECYPYPATDTTMPVTDAFAQAQERIAAEHAPEMPHDALTRLINGMVWMGVDEQAKALNQIARLNQTVNARQRDYDDAKETAKDAKKDLEAAQTTLTEYINSVTTQQPQPALPFDGAQREADARRMEAAAENPVGDLPLEDQDAGDEDAAADAPVSEGAHA